MVNKEFNPDEHLFLCCSKPDDTVLSSNNNVEFLLNPYRKNFIRNTFLFYRIIFKASGIILHGPHLLYYFLFCPWKLGKTYWIIQGYEIPDKITDMEEPGLNPFLNFTNRFVLKRVYGHVTHIEGDSEFINRVYKSSAKLFYSPVYLSNIVSDSKNRISEPGIRDDVTRILAGNSTSPTNNHDSILKMLLPYRDENIVIYCPLSYGIYHEYRDSVIRKAKELFGNKFVPMTEFMSIDEYLTFLGKIDIAVFNHQRQEAMGVTLQLLSLGKVIYMNKNTTSYRSFRGRGIKVFDNELIGQNGLYKGMDVSANPDLVRTSYNYDRLINSLSVVFND
jgi:hypothetical protein